MTIPMFSVYEKPWIIKVENVSDGPLVVDERTMQPGEFFVAGRFEDPLHASIQADQVQQQLGEGFAVLVWTDWRK